jgi:phage FluMu gp28-like protein
MFGMIPLPYKLLAAAALLIGIFFYGYMKGSAYAEAELQRFAAESATKVAELEKKNAEISGKVVTEFVDRTNTIREKEYVYLDHAKNTVPSQSVLSNGWVFTHDASASNGDADATRSSDASPSGIKDNEALLTIVSNYSRCLQNNQQLTSLQEWINNNKRAVDEANTEKGKKK